MPIQLDNYENGVGYSLFFHFIARDIHSDIVEMLKDDIKEVSGKLGVPQEESLVFGIILLSAE